MIHLWTINILWLTITSLFNVLTFCFRKSRNSIIFITHLLVSRIRPQKCGHLLRALQTRRSPEITGCIGHRVWWPKTLSYHKVFGHYWYLTHSVIILLLIHWSEEKWLSVLITILITISFKYVSKGTVGIKPQLIQIMTWRWINDALVYWHIYIRLSRSKCLGTCWVPNHFLSRCWFIFEIFLAQTYALSSKIITPDNLFAVIGIIPGINSLQIKTKQTFICSQYIKSISCMYTQKQDSCNVACLKSVFVSGHMVALVACRAQKTVPDSPGERPALSTPHSASNRHPNQCQLTLIPYGIALNVTRAMPSHTTTCICKHHVIQSLKPKLPFISSTPHHFTWIAFHVTFNSFASAMCEMQIFNTLFLQ